MKNFTIESFDGTPLYCYLFDEVENPKGVVMVVHGMGEHTGRYKAFSEYLNKAGYLVFGDDHRGHGLSETDENRGHHDGDMFEDTVKDEVFFYDFLKKKYDLPVRASFSPQKIADFIRKDKKAEGNNDLIDVVYADDIGKYSFRTKSVPDILELCEVIL